MPLKNVQKKKELRHFISLSNNNDKKESQAIPEGGRNGSCLTACYQSFFDLH